jgi:Icc-related predicted phosphoesterase
LLGNLKSKNADPRSYGEILKALGETHLPSFYIPGPEDCPFSEYLREAANFEVVFPHLHGVHGTFAMAPGYVVVAGMGGTIEDDPAVVREEVQGLKYPAWEVAYRLKFLRELKDYQKLFVFTTAPEHKGLADKGSAGLAEIIKTHNPRLVLVGGRSQKVEMLGTSQTVMLGSLAESSFTVVDLRKHQVVFGHLGEKVSTAA